MNNKEISVRLVLRVSSAGLVSRRKAAEAIKAGKVRVNDVIVTNPALPVTSDDAVFFDGVPVPAMSRKYYIALHKPRGYMSSNQDKHAEKLAVELIDLPENVRLFSAGRLDVDSSGLLIFSNDGDFVNILTHPSFGVTKSYTVTVDRELSEKYLKIFLHGIMSDGELLKALEVEPVGKKQSSFVLGEGKKRHIRRMIRAAGANVIELTRVRHGDIFLGGLPSGKWRDLTAEEIKSVMDINS